MSALSAGLFAKHAVNSAQRSSGLVWGLMAQFPGFASHESSLHLRADYQSAWVAQLVERQSAVWEVEGSSPRSDQHSGS